MRAELQQHRQQPAEVREHVACDRRALPPRCAPETRPPGCCSASRRCARSMRVERAAEQRARGRAPRASAAAAPARGRSSPAAYSSRCRIVGRPLAQSLVPRARRRDRVSSATRRTSSAGSISMISGTQAIGTGTAGTAAAARDPSPSSRRAPRPCRRARPTIRARSRARVRDDDRGTPARRAIVQPAARRSRRNPPDCAMPATATTDRPRRASTGAPDGVRRARGDPKRRARARPAGRDVDPARLARRAR